MEETYTVNKQRRKTRDQHKVLLREKLCLFLLLVPGEENSPGWSCGENDGKMMAPLACPLLTCQMPVFAMKSPERKVTDDLFSLSN